MGTENTNPVVWDALGDTSEQTTNMRIRSELMQRIAAITNDKNWTQAEAAKQFGVNQPRMNDLLRGRVSRFSLDALVNMLASIGKRFNVTLIDEATSSDDLKNEAIALGKIAPSPSSNTDLFSIDENWSLQQIIYFDDELCKQKPEMRGKPDSPRGKWDALQKLKHYEKVYTEGTSIALLLAIKKCMESKLVVPDWAAKEFVRKFNRVDSLEVLSWDDAFGRPYKKGMTAAAKKRQEQLAPIVLQKVVDNYCSDNRRAIDVGLFEEIGGSLGISTATAQRYYRYARKRDWFADTLLPNSNRKKRASKI